MHLRVEADPAIDLLGVYQHAWNLQSNPNNLSLDQRTQELLQSRAQIRDAIGSWTRSIPRRNSLMVLGDFNAALTEHKPHVGPGTMPHTQSHPDQSDFQNLVVSLGLNALNTWGRHGNKAGTFIMHSGSKVQIDYMLSRLPCEPDLLTAATVPEAPVIHPTGFRHIPVLGFLRRPVVPKHRQAQHKLQPRQIQQELARDPGLASRFRDAVQRQLPHHDCLNHCLQAAWTSVASSSTPRPADHIRPGPSLKEYWQAKQHLRHSLEVVDTYHAPVMYHVAHCSTASLLRSFPGSTRALQPVLQAWKASIAFHATDKQLRKQVRERKSRQFDALVEQAEQAAKQGLPAVYQLIKQQAPKSSKRSIHFRSRDGMLMSPAQELHALTQYFTEIYQSSRLDHATTPTWSLHQHFNITTTEVQTALHALQSQKARPDGDTPAILWKTASAEITQPLTDSLNSYLESGPLEFPERWHESHLVLIPKPSKPPNCPANLRPISLLTVEAKLLAKIAADRLRPWTQQVLDTLPQFAYSPHWQTADAIDRVLSHCASIRAAVSQNRRSVHKTIKGVVGSKLAGGLQVSLDLSKAYDYLLPTKAPIVSCIPTVVCT